MLALKFQNQEKALPEGVDGVHVDILDKKAGVNPQADQDMGGD
jgi:hypothetical protein